MANNQSRFTGRRKFMYGLTMTAASLGILGVRSAYPARPGQSNISEGAKKKILLLTGSPRENGNSNELAAQLIHGSQEKGMMFFALTAPKQCPSLHSLQ